MYITMRLHCYDHNVDFPPFYYFFVNGLIVESVNDPYRLLLWVKSCNTSSQILSGTYMDK